jgi:hypothetical protein
VNRGVVVPDLSAGRCQPGRSALPPGAWAGDGTPAEHRAAAFLCEACSCLAPCREWAVTAMPGLAHFAGVIGGMTRGMLEAERARRRRAESPLRR